MQERKQKNKEMKEETETVRESEKYKEKL